MAKKVTPGRPAYFKKQPCLYFEPECFERDLKSEMLGTKAIRRLKAEAVPTIFSFAPSKPQHTTSLKRSHTAVSSQTVILFVRS